MGQNPKHGDPNWRANANYSRVIGPVAPCIAQACRSKTFTNYHFLDFLKQHDFNGNRTWKLCMEGFAGNALATVEVPHDRIGGNKFRVFVEVQHPDASSHASLGKNDGSPIFKLSDFGLDRYRQFWDNKADLSEKK